MRILVKYDKIRGSVTHTIRCLTQVTNCDPLSDLLDPTWESAGEKNTFPERLIRTRVRKMREMVIIV